MSQDLLRHLPMDVLNSITSFVASVSPSQGQHGKLIWKLDSYGNFSTKLAWNLARQQGTQYFYP